MNLRQTASKGV